MASLDTAALRRPGERIYDPIDSQGCHGPIACYAVGRSLVRLGPVFSGRRPVCLGIRGPIVSTFIVAAIVAALLCHASKKPRLKVTAPMPICESLVNLSAGAADPIVYGTPLRPH